jgi:hypothetical protein
LRRLGWPEAHLTSRPKRDPGQPGDSCATAQKNTLSVKNIAARLHLARQPLARKPTNSCRCMGSKADGALLLKKRILCSQQLTPASKDFCKVQKFCAFDVVEAPTAIFDGPTGALSR